MKLKNGMIVLMYVFAMSNLQAHRIDPIEDFRYPESLFEIVHEGIVHVMYMIKNHAHDQNLIQNVFDALHDIQDQCDVAMRYNPNSIKSDEDREYLASMIDRLEFLVDDLHGNSKVSSEIKDTCEYLRMKVMQRS